jgi:hypothetical protein
MTLVGLRWKRVDGIDEMAGAGVAALRRVVPLTKRGGVSAEILGSCYSIPVTSGDRKGEGTGESHG